MTIMVKNNLLILLFLSMGIILNAQEDNEKVMMVGLQKDNILVNNSMKDLANEKGFTLQAIKENSVKASQSAFRDVVKQYNFSTMGIGDQVALSSSEFGELTQKDRIDKLADEEKKKSFIQWLKGLFISGPENEYMAASFSADKMDRIKTTLEQQKAQYLVILHKFEMNRKLFGDAEMTLHYSVLNNKGEIVLGEQRAYKAEMEKSMKKNIFNYLIHSSFLDVYGVMFDKLN